MCERLIREYRIWLEELLEVLYEVCEDVVPAGRVCEDIYWRTKALYKECKREKTEEVASVLLRYAEDGRALLESVKTAIATVQSENNQSDRVEITEETIIRLRRENANAILVSLQMLTNYIYLVAQYSGYTEKTNRATSLYGELGQLFEIDTLDEVKRIRTGVTVERNIESREAASIIRTFNFQEQGEKVWKGYVAG